MSQEAILSALLAEGASPTLVSEVRKLIACACSTAAATGATGESGADLILTLGWPSYGEIFALMPGDNAATVAAGVAVRFPQTKVLRGGVAPLDDGLPTPLGNDTLTLPFAGSWLISAQVSVAEAGQLVVAVKQGGTGSFVEDPTTVAGRATGTDQIIISTVILATLPNTQVQIRNPTGNAAALTITPSAGGTHAVSATFRAELLP